MYFPEGCLDSAVHSIGKWKLSVTSDVKSIKILSSFRFPNLGSLLDPGLALEVDTSHFPSPRFPRMSVVLDKVNALKSQLSIHAASQIQSLPPNLPQSQSSVYLTELNASLSILSATSHTTPSLDQVIRLLIEVNRAKLTESETITQTEYAKELEWLFLARCTIDVYGALLQQLFQQTLPLAQDIFYWDDVLIQPTWRLLYLIQSIHPQYLS